VIRIDAEQDVALLRADWRQPSSCLPTRSEAAELGEEVYAIGAPFDRKLSFSLTCGIVSGMRELKGTRLVQTDASVNAGNSGGPLVDDKGRLVAVVRSKLAGFGVEGVPGPAGRDSTGIARAIANGPACPSHRERDRRCHRCRAGCGQLWVVQELGDDDEFPVRVPAFLQRRRLGGGRGRQQCASVNLGIRYGSPTSCSPSRFARHRTCLCRSVREFLMTCTTRTALTVFLAGLLGFTGGCLRYESYERICQVDGDCDKGSYCQDRTCLPGCRGDSDCGSLNICQEHACMEGCRIVKDCGGTTMQDGYKTYPRACIRNTCFLLCAVDQLCRALDDNCLPTCPYGLVCNQSTQYCNKSDASGR